MNMMILIEAEKGVNTAMIKEEKNNHVYNKILSRSSGIISIMI